VLRNMSHQEWRRASAERDTDFKQVKKQTQGINTGTQTMV
jgi:hypothetical protein